MMAPPIVYQISVRPWLYHLSQTLKQEITRLSQVPGKEWKKIADDGFDMVWLMGIWELGNYGLYHDRISVTNRRDYGAILPDFTVSHHPSLHVDVDVDVHHVHLHVRLVFHVRRCSCVPPLSFNRWWIVLMLFCCHL